MNVLFKKQQIVFNHYICVFFGENVEECKTNLTDLANQDSSDTGSSALVYDKEEAKECLAELEALTCDDVYNQE